LLKSTDKSPVVSNVLQDMKKLNLTCPICEIYKVGLEMSHMHFISKKNQELTESILQIFANCAKMTLRTVNILLMVGYWGRTGGGLEGQ